MAHVVSLVVVLKTGTLLLGGLITYFACKAYRRTGAAALRALTIGFGIITTGAILAGAADQVLQVDRTYALIVESSLTTFGLLVILYSLYAE